MKTPAGGSSQDLAIGNKVSPLNENHPRATPPPIISGLLRRVSTLTVEIAAQFLRGLTQTGPGGL
jgi:hypothetical protein